MRRDRTRPPAVEGYVAADDGVRLYYRAVGVGDPTVVVPFGFYLAEVLAPLARGRRVIFYDPRGRGRSDRGDPSAVSLDRQVADLEQLRAAFQLERMVLVGWSGMGMEAAVYALRHPDRVLRLVQVAPVPPAAAVFREAGGDRRDDRIAREALAALDARFDAGAFDDDPAGYCRARQRLTLPSNFADTAKAATVPDVCVHENEWPVNLFPYFEALLGSFGDYDWRDALASLDVPRLVIHGREDGIPLAGAEAWTAGFDQARLLVLSPAGHFPFVEQPASFFAAVEAFLGGAWPEGAVAL